MHEIIILPIQYKSYILYNPKNHTTYWKRNISMILLVKIYMRKNRYALEKLRKKNKEDRIN